MDIVFEFDGSIFVVLWKLLVECAKSGVDLGGAESREDLPGH